MFPISSIADIVNVLSEIVGDKDEFIALRNDIDRISQDRAGTGEVAGRSFSRAEAHLNAGRTMAAIDELQRSKVNAFTGDHLYRSVSSMILLSDCYSKLGLHIASRYYSSGAVFFILKSDDDRMLRLLSRAAFQLASTFYASGEWTTFLLVLNEVFAIYSSTGILSGEEYHHTEANTALIHAFVFRTIAHRLAPILGDLIAEALAGLPLREEEARDLMALSVSDKTPWATMDPTEIEAVVQSDLGRSPFTDVGCRRTVRWSALGIVWTVEYDGSEQTALAALELVATLQIAQVELARFELLIVPSDVFIFVDVGKIARPDLKAFARQCDRLAWKALLPIEADSSETTAGAGLAAIVFSVIGQATALRADAFHHIIEDAYRRGLGTRAFSVRPARELLQFAYLGAYGLEQLLSLDAVVLDTTFSPGEPSELAWRSTPGPGYSNATATEFLQNRYRRTTELMQYTLPRIVADTRALNILKRLKSEGALNWQILGALSSMVVQFQVDASYGGVSVADQARYRARVSRPERKDDPAFDLSLVTNERLDVQMKTSLAASFQTWGLELHTQTPNFEGIKRLLDVRYGHSS